MSLADSNGSIASFAETFLARLQGVPVAYERSYNAPHKPSHDLSGVAAKKPVVNIVEVNLRSLYGSPAAGKVRISKNESSLIKIFREAASILGCSMSDVLLVKDGQVLRESSVSRATSNTLTPVYIFDKRLVSEDGPSASSGTTKSEELQKEFAQLLRRYFEPRHAAMLSSRFMQEYKGWIKE